MAEHDHNDQEGGTKAAVKEKAKTIKPPLYAVLLLNDDYTPMDFVVHIIIKFFQKSEEEATKIMLEVHKKGQGVCGIFTREIAETKANVVVAYAQQNQFPLQSKIEAV